MITALLVINHCLKAKEATERLIADGLTPGNGEIKFLQLDMRDPRNAKVAAEEFLAKENRLDVLGK